MAWRDRLRPASFRGAAFEVADTDGETGRRLAVNEYPSRDEPFVEDLGRKARRFTVTGYVIGPDYMDRLEAVLRAAEADGPGTLVHFFRGELQVHCEALRYAESQNEGGMARLTFTFVEAGGVRAPADAPDTRALTGAAADDALSAARTVFNREFTLTRLPEFVAAEAAAWGADLAATVAGLPVAPDSTANVKADLDTAIRDLATNGATLFRSVDPAAPILDLLRLFGWAAGTTQQGRRTVLTGLRDVAAFPAAQPAPAMPTTPVRQRLAANQGQLARLTVRAALAEQARVSAGLDYDSRDDAVAVRDALTRDLRDAATEAADAGEDEAYGALKSLSAAVTRDLTRRGASLAPITRYRMGAVLPALTLAHRLYGDAGRADEVAARNRAAHPGFMPVRGEALSE